MTNAGAGTYDIRGGSSGDTLTGSAQVDTLTGNGGDDTLQGKAGDDTMTGGAGNDTFKVDVGSDIITDLGGASGGDSDVLIVSDGATANVTNVKNFVAGATTTSNSSGTVNISTHTDGGIVNMSAASGGYNLTGQGGVDTLSGGKGDDTINGGVNADTISGGTGDDTLSGGADNDQMTGGDGVDTFKVDAGTDTITDLGGTAGGQTDVLIVSNGATANATNIANFTAGSTTKNQGTANLTTKVDGGTIDVGASVTGAYNLTGLSGNDTLKGNGNNDTINGGSGDDQIDGRGGNDIINAGAGDDIITVSTAGDANGDTIDGGDGTDTLSLASGSHSFATNANLQGIDSITLASSATVVDLTGQTESLSITGGAGGDTITSGSGDDIINGAGGADIITGADGKDTISLGSSDNASDVIIFSKASSLTGMDIINQFNAGATNGDILKYIGNLSDVESSANTTNGSDGNDDLLNADFVTNAKNSSLDITHLVVGFTTAVTVTGQAGGTAIDFTGAGISSSQILGAIETSLENTNDGSGGGNGLLSGASGAQVTQGDINESKLLLFTDGGSGSAQDVAMVLYEEGSASEANFNTELTLASVLKSVDIATLTHDNFWG